MNPENRESAPDISTHLISPLFWEERPITIDEACDIKLLLFGNTEKSFSTAWVKQGFMFRAYPSYGLLQLNAGPCGIVASVQACVLYELLFGFSATVLDEGFLIVSDAERREALSRALSSILWQAGQGKKAIVAKKSEEIVLNETIRSGILEGDGILECVKLKYFESIEDLLAHVFNFIQLFMNEEGCILFVYSVLLTHGIDKIKEEMDNAEHHLIGTDGYCSLELVNLILTGRAVPNVHDGDISLETEEQDSPLLLRGIPNQSKIGFLTMFEQQDLLSVGSYYKDPVYPIWVLQGNSHFSILFGTDKTIFRQTLQTFKLFYLDCAKKDNEETLLTINPEGEVTEDDHSSWPVYKCCIKSRWPQATVETEVISRN